MTYELAKQLKDAGFIADNTAQFDGGRGFYPDPTLSELIEACGERFGGLNVFASDDLEIALGIPIGWHVWSKGADIHCRGNPTPEEAVARLWLELNK